VHGNYEQFKSSNKKIQSQVGQNQDKFQRLKEQEDQQAQEVQTLVDQLDQKIADNNDLLQNKIGQFKVTEKDLLRLRSQVESL